MKAGTAARLFRAIALVAVLLISAIPVVTALSDMDSEPISIRTEATYQLEYMDESTLASNLRQAVSDKTGCIVRFGEQSSPVDESNCDAVAATIKSSGAKTATVYDSEGQKLTQSNVEYRNDVVWGGRIGVSVPGMVSDVSKMDIKVRLVSTDGKIDILTDSMESGIEGEIGGQYLVPLVVYNVAGAYGCDLGTSIGMEYEKLVKVGALSKVDTVDYDYTLTTDGTTSTLVVKGCMASGTGTGSVGDASLSYGYDGGWNMTISSTGRISDALKDSLVDGGLKVTTGGDSYTMGAELSASFISAIVALEEAVA